MYVKRKNLSDLVILRIREYIERNNLRVGDRLPTEQDMADSFGVSRISVREATRALSFFGVIESAPRRGLTIGPVNMDRVAEILNFHFMIDDYPRELLLKARLVVEIGSLQYSMKAVALDDKLHAELIGICDKMDQTSSPSDFITCDAEFHRKLVSASGVGPLLAFNDVLQAFFLKYRQEILSHTEEGLRAGARTHREIIEALRESKVDVAEKKLREHLLAVEAKIGQTPTNQPSQT